MIPIFQHVPVRLPPRTSQTHSRGTPAIQLSPSKRSLLLTPSERAPKMASLHPIKRARPQAKSQWCKPAYRGPFPLYSSFFHPSCSLDRECIPSSLPAALSLIFFVLLLFFLPPFLLPCHRPCLLINQLLVYLSVCCRPAARVVVLWSQSLPLPPHLRRPSSSPDPNHEALSAPTE